LLDSNFNLKIADFGLSTSVETTYSDGVMHTRVGTERYMPPEMLEKNAYVGVCSDLFAAGIILYVLVLGNMPTQKRAESDDYLYKFIRNKKYEQYWKSIQSLYDIDLSNISEEFFHLVTNMLKYNYKKRFTIEEIKAHPWMQGPVATQEEVHEELMERKKDIERKLNSVDDFGGYESTIDSLTEEYNDAVKRSGADAWSEDAGRERKVKIYAGTSRHTEFFSTFSPAVLLGALLNFAAEKKIDEKVSANSYKVTISVTSEQGNIVTFVA
jgi:serine/threonine protein kinase